MVVDHQTHWLPPAALDLLAARVGAPRVRRADGRYLIELRPGAPVPLAPIHSDLDAQLQAAEDDGVDVLVSSPNLLGELLDLPAAEAADLLAATNAVVAAAQREHAGRFVGIAMLPLQDPDAALTTLDDAHRLGLRGVCVLPTVAGAPLVNEGTETVFARMQALGMPLVLHPEMRSWSPVPGIRPRAAVGVGWMYGTTLAALDLIDSGLLDRLPRLVVLHPHLGGVLPWVYGRVDRMGLGEERPSIAEYLRTRFYTDAVSATPGALRFALELYGRERVLFASDEPYMPVAGARAYVENENGTAIYANHLPGLPLPG